MIKEAIILAGGLGTRLKEVSGDIPKSMVPICNKPFLEYQLGFLDSWGIQHVVLSVGYKKEFIINHFGSSFKGISIDYCIEDEPLGTGGAVAKSMELINKHAAFVFNGDTFFEVNLHRLYDFRRIKECDICLVIRFVDNVSRYGSVVTNEEFRITGFTEKGSITGEGYINGGVYYIDKRTFMSQGLPEKFSLENDFFGKYYSRLRLYGLRCFSYFRDIGVPEDYFNAQNEFLSLPY